MSKITDIAGTDFLSVEAFHAMATTVREECWANVQALGAIAAGITSALEQAPRYDPKTRRKVIDKTSIANAREVGAYFRRCATSQTSCAAEVASAWSVFNNRILDPAAQAAKSPPAPAGGPQGGPFTGLP
jgi:hypothetical protein